MPLSTVIHLQALAPGQVEQFTGRGVHGFWFAHWRKAAAALGDQLHDNGQETSFDAAHTVPASYREDKPFTLSPLVNLPRPRKGTASIPAGQTTWLRVAILSDALAAAFSSQWLPALPIGSEIEIPQTRQEGESLIPGLRWKVTGVSQERAAHPMAAQVAYEELSRLHLMNPNPPRQWRLEFLTPTTFHGKSTHLPFPLPESLIGSWLRRWQAFAPIALPEEELLAWARTNLAVSAYTLHTLPVREAERLRVGCVGRLTLRAVDMPPYLRAAVDLLANYAFFCGSGSHTAQGMGQTVLSSVQ